MSVTVTEAPASTGEDVQLHHVEDHHHATRVKRKAERHLYCLAFGIVISVVCTYIPSEIALHFSFVAAGVPSVVQEVLDAVREAVTEAV